MGIVWVIITDLNTYMISQIYKTVWFKKNLWGQDLYYVLDISCITNFVYWSQTISAWKVNLKWDAYIGDVYHARFTYRIGVRLKLLLSINFNTRNRRFRPAVLNVWLCHYRALKSPITNCRSLWFVTKVFLVWNLESYYIFICSGSFITFLIIAVKRANII